MGLACRIALIAVILMWAPRESRTCLMRPSQPENDWLADDTSLPDGHGSVAVPIERPTGAVAVFWKDTTPQVVLDVQEATVARWGTNRYVLTVGPHDLRVDVTSPFPELARTNGNAQRQLIIEEKSEIRLVYVPLPAPTLPGHLVPRKAPSGTAKR